MCERQIERPTNSSTSAATARRAASDPATAGCAPVGESHVGDWVAREIWTERMLAALATASKEGKENKWFSLIDKVWRDSHVAGGLETSQKQTRRGRNRRHQHRAL